MRRIVAVFREEERPFPEERGLNGDEALLPSVVTGSGPVHGCPALLRTGAGGAREEMGS
jgi:hypothetical protein